jgi:hypothetical protein
MEEQRLGPGVERRDDAGLGSQVLRIPQQGAERVVDAGKQQLRHDRDIAQPEIIELMGDREDDMIMFAGQQPRLLLGQPPFHLYPGTLRAHAMPTRIVPHAFHMAIRAHLHVSTQHGRATDQDRPDGPTRIIGQAMRAGIGRITQLENCWQCDLVCVQGLSITAHASFHPFSRMRHIPRLCGSVQPLIN